MKRTRLIAVGACAIDTILTVPHFPDEDSKLRASSFVKRRGGNSPNSFEVLEQLIELDRTNDGHNENQEGHLARKTAPELFLIVTLPSRDSDSVAFIASSFGRHLQSAERNTDLVSPATPSVDLSHAVYREYFTEPVSSYIISSQATSSRTIISRNEMPEMTFDDFVSRVDNILDAQNFASLERIWFHFEGRIPDTTLQCIQYLRNLNVFESNRSDHRRGLELTVSVELEKPDRQGLQELAQEADVIFYSKAWAKGQGYGSAEACLMQQAKILSEEHNETHFRERTLICTWGEQGASALTLRSTDSHAERLVIHSPAYSVDEQPILDSTGAGDTFIAGVLFGFINREQKNVVGPSWSLSQTLDFANGLAGRKILQNGFQRLGESTRELRMALDGNAE